MMRTKDLLARMITRSHETVFKASGGRLLRSFGGMPVVMLTTTGRKSGKPRTIMLTSPVQDGDKVVLVASYGGDDRHPAWFLNLRDNPEVGVVMHGRSGRMTARIATPDERKDLWSRVTQKYHGYGIYQQQTDREIPLVILEP